MKTSTLARSTVGIATAAAMGVATIAAAATASADMTITASSAYCVGTTYTVTVPAADLTARMQASYYHSPSDTSPDTMLEWSESPESGGNTWFPPAVAYVAGQDVHFQWTPTAAGKAKLILWGVYKDFYGSLRQDPYNTFTSPTWNVVQSAPAGASCNGPSTGGTGSASSIPVIGPLLDNVSTLSSK